jgi:hypothetical protein
LTRANAEKPYAGDTNTIKIILSIFAEVKKMYSSD